MRKFLFLFPIAFGFAAAEDSGASRLAEIEKSFGAPVMGVSRPAAPPAIDGKLDDAAWAAADAVVLGHLVGGWDTPTQKTEVRVLADEKAVYFGVRCFESQMDRVISAGQGRDGDIWSGDTIEFFLDPGHREVRHEYFHLIVNPKGLLYDGRGRDKKAWDSGAEVKTGVFEGGWTAECAVPMKDLGLAAGEIPKVWGLNINRQRPQLGCVKPKGATLNPALVKLNEPEKYRDGEDTAWAPTGCESSHIVQRFGHALFEAGTKEVAPPAKLFEVLCKAAFDDGNTGVFHEAVIQDESFRGPGKCIAPKDPKTPIFLRKALEELDDVTLIYALKMPKNGRLYYYGRAPDSEQCEADRHEVFLTKEEAAARAFPSLDLYHTHADKMAWMPNGRLWKAPGGWAMMTGHFSEPSIGSVISPGSDWVIVRTHLGRFRRQRSQGEVPISQNYPNGLIFHAGEPFLMDEVVIFRGVDREPPQTVKDAAYRTEGEDRVLAWPPARDNTLTAYYRVLVDGKALLETHRLSARLKAADAAGKTLTVAACDLYGNASAPSAPATEKKE